MRKFVYYFNFIAAGVQALGLIFNIVNFILNDVNIVATIVSCLAQAAYIGYVFYNRKKYQEQYKKHGNWEQDKKQCQELQRQITDKVVKYLSLFDGRQLSHVPHFYIATINGVVYNLNAQRNYIMEDNISSGKRIGRNKTYYEDLLEWQEMNRYVDKIIKLKAFT